MHVPRATNVIWDPATPLDVHTEGVVVAYRTLRPEEAVAFTKNEDAPSGRLLNAAKVIVCAPLATLKLCVTFGAAAYVALPAWAAWIVQVPVARRVTVAAFTEQTDVVSDEKPTARPEDAVALIAKGAVP